MATNDQKNQLIAKLATETDPRKWPDNRNFQLLVGLSAEDFDTEIAKLFNGWQPPVLNTAPVSIIQTNTLQNPKFPDWSRGRVLNGVVQPKMLDLAKLPADAWFHPNQVGNKTRPTGHQILAMLVQNYEVGKDEVGKTYQVHSADLVNGHFGLRELVWLEQKWKTLPEAFRKWAKGKPLYGWADVVRGGSGCLLVPSLYCNVEEPYVAWYGLGNEWHDDEPALRE